MGAAPDDSGVAIGTVVAGRYRIASVLGAGGMGRVYRGEHTAIGRPVAVKVLRGALGRNQEAAARFQREAIASGRLAHPNIVSVIDFGTLDDGCLFLVMEALEGEHLGDRLAREKRIPWPDALMIVRGVLLALRHAHERGVVHRDVKPDNIFLAQKGGHTVVKLFDFGIAKLYAGEAEDPLATRAGIAVGTPTYLSPEQAVGGEITPASDIYSASIVLYELLVGRAPFESVDSLALLQAHAGGEVPMFRELAPDLEVPDGVERLVREGLAKIPRERVGSAEYVQQIDQILSAHGIDVVPALFARASRPMATPAGPYVATQGASFPSSPTRFPVATPAAPAQTSSDPRRAKRRTSILLAGIAAVAIVGAIAVLAQRRSELDRTAPVSAPTSPAPVAAPPDHETQLKLALHELETGATCLERKNAIGKLVELRDPKAVAPIKRARAQARANACLRVAADRAIKALDGRI